MGLPGVRVGPLDPDATSGFGQVAARSSARQLIRLHTQLHPPRLTKQLARPMDEPHTKAAKENLDEIREHLAGLTHDNGDPLIPEGAEVVDAAVRGDKATGRVLTFQYRLPSGRIGKWFTPYSEEHLPGVYESGAELTKVKEMKDRGIVAFDSEGTAAEIARRQLREVARERDALRRALEARGDVGEDVPEGPEVDTRDGVNLADENERLGRENEELREKLARFEAFEQAGQGGTPTGGLEADLAARGGEGDPQGGGAAAQEPPIEDYDNLNADVVVGRIKAEETSDDDVRAILEYERGHADRKSVVGAAEQRLDRSS